MRAAHGADVRSAVVPPARRTLGAVGERGRSGGRPVWLPVFGLMVLATAACGAGGCKTYAVPSLRVHVTDRAGAAVCDAAVVAQEGRTSVSLQPATDASSSCSYVGPWEEAGTFRVEASARGLVAAVDEVKVTAEACHVRPQDVALVLR